MDGKVPMEILAENTDKSIMLQLDVGHCLAGGGDPVAWINNHPGRTRSLHLKDWSKEKEFQACSAKESRRGRRYSLRPRIKAASSIT